MKEIEPLLTIFFKDGDIIQCGESKLEEAEESFYIISGIRTNKRGEWVAFYALNGKKDEVESVHKYDIIGKPTQ